MTTWWAISLFSSILSAAYIYINQVVKLPAPLLLVYRGLFLSVILFAFSFNFDAEFSWKFYLLSATAGLIIGFSDNRIFESSKRYGAEITGSLTPFSVVATFFLWLIIDPSRFIDILSTPLHFVVVLSSLLCIVASVIMINKSGKGSKDAIKFLGIVILFVAFCDVIAKESMSIKGSNPTLVAAYYYTMVTSFFIGIYGLIVYLYNGYSLKKFVEPKNITAGIALMFVVAAVFMLKSYAFNEAPNPAYVSALAFLSPIWIVLANVVYYKINKNNAYIRVNKGAILLLVISIITLVLATR